MSSMTAKAIDGSSSAMANATSSGSIPIINNDNKKSRPRSTRMEENIQVAVRMRPPSPSSTHRRVWRVNAHEKTILETTVEGIHEDGHEVFQYGHTFDEYTSNREVYDRVAERIVACVLLEGYHGTIMTYGQTASGKTFTMQGNGDGNDNMGIIHMAASDIFSHVGQNKYPKSSLEVRVSFLEIYNEVVRDLLAPEGSDPTLRVREDRQEFFVQAAETTVTGVHDLLRVLSEGDKKRNVGATKMNQRSSRSHAIFRIFIDRTIEEEKEGTGTTRSGAISMLNLVDLAGSESVRLTGATGMRLKEAGHINKSLSALSSVISSLGGTTRATATKQQHVNYRNSSLTKLLQPSLSSGNAKVAVICCASLSKMYLAETKSTLQFASRAQLIKTFAKKSRRRVTDHGFGGGGSKESQQCSSSRRASSNVLTPLRKMSMSKKITKLSPSRLFVSPCKSRSTTKRFPLTDVRPRSKRTNILSSSIPEQEGKVDALQEELAKKNAKIATLEEELQTARKTLQTERAEVEWLRLVNANLTSQVSTLLADKEFFDTEKQQAKKCVDSAPLKGSMPSAVRTHASIIEDLQSPERNTISSSRRESHDSDATQEIAIDIEMETPAFEGGCQIPGNDIFNAEKQVKWVNTVPLKGSMSSAASKHIIIGDQSRESNSTASPRREPHYSNDTHETVVDSEIREEDLFVTSESIEFPPYSSPMKTPVSVDKGKARNIHSRKKPLRDRKKTSRYSPGKSAPLASLTRPHVISSMNVEYGAVGYTFRKNFGWYGTYDGIVIEILPDGKRKCNYPADTSARGVEILPLEEIPKPKPARKGKNISLSTKENVNSNVRPQSSQDNKQTYTIEEEDISAYQREVLRRMKQRSQDIVAETIKKGEEALWQGSASCHICHRKRDVCLTFHCGKHSYCDKHCQKRLGFSAFNYDHNTPNDLPINHCPICAMSCKCSKCSRKLDSVAENMKEYCLKKGRKAEDVKVNLVKLCQL